MTTRFLGWVSEIARTHARPLATTAVRQGLTRVEAIDDERLDAAEELPADVPSVDALLLAAEEHVALLGCVSQLAEIQRRVVTMRVLEELSPDEVAGELGLTPGHIGVLLHRSKRALIDCMDRARTAVASRYAPAELRNVRPRAEYQRS